jgi:ribosomal-protein-alanine N-acetyltransferase
MTNVSGSDLMDTSHARVLPLRAEHLDAVLAIEFQSSPAGWNRNIFLAELERPESRCYLVVELPEHGVVGFGGMQMLTDDAHITTIAVAPGHRRRKLATRLLIELLRAARAWGAHAATLEVRLHNTAAQRLYAGFGFRPVGVRPRYYEGSADALIMWAHDVDGTAFGNMLDALEAAVVDRMTVSTGHRGES